MVVGLLQSALYPNGQAVNPTEPLNESNRRIKDNGQLYVNEIKFGETYPNSYLDRESINYFIENYKKSPVIIEEWDERL